MWILIIISILVLYIFLICPNLKRRNELNKYKINYYHRGYFDNKTIAENSLEAFKKAINHNTAIELDVHISKDNKLVIMHDNSLKRMTDIDLKISEVNYNDIKSLRLLNTESKIPLLNEVLELVDSKVLLYIELKGEMNNYKSLVDEVIKMLKTYKGEYILCSFNPFILAYLRKKYPEYHRGLIIENHKKEVGFIGYILQTQFLNVIARPDIISFRFTDVSKFKAKFYHLLNVPLLCWSIKNQNDYDKYHDLFDGVVIEGFTLNE